MENLEKMGFATRQIHGGAEPNQHGALSVPIYQSSTFVFDSAEQGAARFGGKEEGYVYTRLGNPTNGVVERKLALLEGAEAAASMASGIGAISSTLWTFLKAGDHMVVSKTLYGCTFALIAHQLTRFGVEVTFVDPKDPENWRKAMKPNTRIFYAETPANPTMDITDIEEVAKIAHTNKDCLMIIDDTFTTPYIQRPLELGVDIVVHSATKYLNGHGDVCAGFACGKKELIDQIKLVGIKDCTGSVLGAFEAFLVQRGMKTLSIRMDKHCANAQKVAEWLETNENVDRVLYPGLKSFPQYEVAKKQMRLPGGMIAFEIKGGREAGKQLMNNVKLCSLAVSLGDTETLIQHPASMTHSPLSAEELADAGISEGLVRLSIGLEDADDIIADLEQAFNNIKF